MQKFPFETLTIEKQISFFCYQPRQILILLGIFSLLQTCYKFVANCNVLSTFIITVGGIDHLIGLKYSESSSFFEYFVPLSPTGSSIFLRRSRLHLGATLLRGGQGRVSQLNHFLVASVASQPSLLRKKRKGPDSNCRPLAPWDDKLDRSTMTPHKSRSC